MISLYEPFWKLLRSLEFDEKNRQNLIQETLNKLENPIQGDYPRWYSAYKNLPDIVSSTKNPNNDAIYCQAHLNQVEKDKIKKSYQQLIPWRKGPFELFDTYIDSEWQSFMKWNRIQSKIPELTNKRILDVGCGNGYYMFRMSTQKPLLLMGIDPGLLQIMQFWSVEKYIKSHAAALPLSLDELPKKLNYFDVVFSMGVLYHRKSPIHHLKALFDCLKANAYLVLETLIINGDHNSCLIPTNRYAQMRNVWFLPSVKMLEIMLKRSGFNEIKCIDVTTTTTAEQRATDWMKFHSLQQFLDEKSEFTIEGYPIPKRATIVAKKS